MKSDPLANNDKRQALVLLTGITANSAKKSHLLSYFQQNSRFSVFLPGLCQYFGVKFAANQLVRFLDHHKLADFSKCHFICYISGGLILRSALASQPLANTGRIVYIRSPFQELLPGLAIQKYGRLPTLIRYGKMLLDLTSQLKMEPAIAAAETGVVIERGLSASALQMGLKKSDFERYRHRSDFVMPPALETLTTPLSHDEVYTNDELLETLNRFIQSGHFKVNPNVG
ncbi:MAG: hypothetical protein KGZ88_19655 [Methylomicrobium sp.]|nr:hypothetical protein [Methylomicrobium sp.]